MNRPPPRLYKSTETMDTENEKQLTAEEWDQLRERFRHSMMAKTEISKLAQNIDVIWPIRGKDEIPLKYLPLTHDELMITPGIVEKPERARLLADILIETMAFDDPFGEMAEHVDSSSRHDESAAKAMRELDVSADYPIALSNVAQETRDLCEFEEIKTVGDFIRFSQTMAQNVVVGGDFRTFLNSFVHEDEKAMARYLPVRPGRSGLHLAEALGLAVERLSKEEYLYFLEVAGGEPTAEDRKNVRHLSDREVAEMKRRLHAELTPLFEWFGEQTENLRDALAEGGASTDRYFVPLDNPNKEKVAIRLARLGLEDEERESTETKRGFFARFFGR